MTIAHTPVPSTAHVPLSSAPSCHPPHPKRITSTNTLHAPPPTVTQSDLNHLFSFFSAYQPSASSRHSLEVLAIHAKVHALFSQDYETTLVPNDWCATYPATLIVPSRERSGVLVNHAPSLVPLFRNSRFSRVRSRFVVPVLVVNGRNVCRSATLSNEAEVHINSFTELTKQFTRTMFNYPSEPAVSPSSSEPNSDDDVSARTTIEIQRTADIALLRALNVTEIFDLMVENRKVKFGLTVTSSEKTDTRNRYADFNVVPIPYPGVEFFADFKARNYCARGLRFDWSQAFADAELNVSRAAVMHSFSAKRLLSVETPVPLNPSSLSSSSSSLLSPTRLSRINTLSLPKSSSSIVLSSVPSPDSSPVVGNLRMLCDPSLWHDWRSWDVIQMTQHYLQLMLHSLTIPQFPQIPNPPTSPFSGINVHCISGWDRTPSFISLIRLSLWADGLAHQSLSAEQVLYLTVAYDWLLFSHLLPDRMSRGEDIFNFCFYMLLYILDDREFSIAPLLSSNGPSSSLRSDLLANPAPPFLKHHVHEITESQPISSASISSADSMTSPTNLLRDQFNRSPGLTEPRLVPMRTPLGSVTAGGLESQHTLLSDHSDSQSSVPGNLWCTNFNPPINGGGITSRMDVPTHGAYRSFGVPQHQSVSQHVIPGQNPSKGSTSWQMVSGQWLPGGRPNSNTDNFSETPPTLGTSFSNFKSLSPPIAPTISNEMGQYIPITDSSLTMRQPLPFSNILDPPANFANRMGSVLGTVPSRNNSESWMLPPSLPSPLAVVRTPPDASPLVSTGGAFTSGRSRWLSDSCLVKTSDPLPMAQQVSPNSIQENVCCPEQEHHRKRTVSSTLSSSWDPGLQSYQKPNGFYTSQTHVQGGDGKAMQARKPRTSLCSKIDLVPMSGCACCQLPGLGHAHSADDDELFAMDGSLLIVAPESNGDSDPIPARAVDCDNFNGPTVTSQPFARMPLTYSTTSSTGSEIVQDSSVHESTSSIAHESCLLKSGRAQKLIRVRNLFAIAYRQLGHTVPSHTSIDWPPLLYARTTHTQQSPSTVTESALSPSLPPPGWTLSSMVSKMTSAATGGPPTSTTTPYITAGPDLTKQAMFHIGPQASVPPPLHSMPPTWRSTTMAAAQSGPIFDIRNDSALHSARHLLSIAPANPSPALHSAAPFSIPTVASPSSTSANSLGVVGVVVQVVISVYTSFYF